MPFRIVIHTSRYSIELFRRITYEKIGDPQFEISGYVAAGVPVPVPTTANVWADYVGNVIGPEYLTGINKGFLLDTTIREPLNTQTARHLRERFAASGLVNTDAFVVEDIAGDHMRLDFLVLSPVSTAPVGVSPQSSEGPIIPNDIFPLTNSINQYYRDGSLTYGGHTRLIKPLESFDEFAGAEVEGYGQVVMPDSIHFYGQSLDHAVGSIESRSRITDKNGNGWMITESYEMVRRPTDVEGDLSYNENLDMHDLNILTQNVAVAPADPHGDFLTRLDVNGDASVDVRDVHYWVTDLKSTWIGDANLDGLFESGDLVDVLGAGKYGTGELALWSEGDWNADELFDSGDLIAAFSDGGYEIGARTAVAAVPEPGSLTLLIGMFAGPLSMLRRMARRAGSSAT